MRQSNVERLAGVVLWTFGLIGVVAIIRFFGLLIGIEPPRDATDSATARSDMALRVDYGTGCQYLASASGSLTPRMGTDGRQICAVQK